MSSAKTIHVSIVVKFGNCSKMYLLFLKSHFLEVIYTIISFDEFTTLTNSSRFNRLNIITFKGFVFGFSFCFNKKGRVKLLPSHEMLTIFITTDQEVIPDHLDVRVKSHSVSFKYALTTSGDGSAIVLTYPGSVAHHANHVSGGPIDAERNLLVLEVVDGVEVAQE